jgi:hypothetical protein
MQPMRLFSALAGLVSIGLSSGAALAQETCPDVTYTKFASDAFVMAGWGCPQSDRNFFAGRYEIYQDDWGGYFGWDHPCFDPSLDNDTITPLARTYNTLALLEYSHSNTTPPNCAGGGATSSIG